MSEDVLLRTKAGRIHRAVMLDGRRLVDERCGLDAAPGQEPIVEAVDIADAPVEAYCRRCFPEHGDDGA